MNSTNRKQGIQSLVAGLLVVAGLLLFADLWQMSQYAEVPYSKFKSLAIQNKLTELEIGPRRLYGSGPDGALLYAVRLPSDVELIKQLDNSSTTYSAPSVARQAFYNVAAPLLVIAGLGVLYFQKTRGNVRGFGSRGSSLLIAKRPTEGFEAVAGCDEAKQDLAEVVDYLREPQRFRDLGANLPRGVLLSGPPGTGKTLLAKALAAEADVPFYSLSGSDFVEMYVGVGASRIRNLFKKAREHSPCIVFIDELDALGKKRDERGNGNEERENTLNQLLVELDGFETDELVILIGATNRPDVIDTALMRPGRFDRQITVDAPDREGRLAILQVHTRNKPLCPNTSLSFLADSTSGMSGAELANIVNESAILAARERAECISDGHISEALERVVAGPIRTSRLLDEKLRKRIAYHEVGHALVAFHSKTADPVQKISIVPRGKAALGYTLQIPVSDTYLLTETELRERIRVLLAGRAAEKLVLGEVSTGAENDLIRASEMVQRMLGHFGMSKSGNLIHVGAAASSGVQSDGGREMDREAQSILTELHDQAEDLLDQHREQLERVTVALLKADTLTAEEFHQILEQPATT